MITTYLHPVPKFKKFCMHAPTRSSHRLISWTSQPQLCCPMIRLSLCRLFSMVPFLLSGLIQCFLESCPSATKICLSLGFLINSALESEHSGPVTPLVQQPPSISSHYFSQPLEFRNSSSGIIRLERSLPVTTWPQRSCPEAPLGCEPLIHGLRDQLSSPVMPSNLCPLNIYWSFCSQLSSPVTHCYWRSSPVILCSELSSPELPF
jgi:hypothetical protein